MKFMKLFLICFAAAGLCWMGCGKSKSSTPVATPSTDPTPAVAEPAPPPPPSPDSQPSDAPAPDAEEPTVAQLNMAVNAYIMGELKEPKTLEDLIKAGYMKRLPAAPPGKKFVLNGNRTQVLLINK
jgi:hypothetical protein